MDVVSKTYIDQLIAEGLISALQNPVNFDGNMNQIQEYILSDVVAFLQQYGVTDEDYVEARAIEVLDLCNSR